MSEHCPECKCKYEIDDITLEWHKYGRTGKCPGCKTKLLFTKQPRGLVKGKSGGLVRRFRKA